MLLLLTSLVTLFFSWSTADCRGKMSMVLVLGCVYLRGRVNCRQRHQSSFVFFVFDTGHRAGQQVVAGSRSRAWVWSFKRGLTGGSLCCSNPGSLLNPRKARCVYRRLGVRFSGRCRINERQTQYDGLVVEAEFGGTDAW